MRLGTDYGGWWLVDDDALRDSVIISAGLGEDASFDIAVADRYGARIIIIDPTPRAIAYFEKIRRPKFILEPHALWHAKTRIKFYAPKDPRHVSYSILNFQNDYREDTDNIEVEAIPIDVLVARYGTPALIKLDIEGAEIEVLSDMLAKNIAPRQILVEYDEMMIPARKSRQRVERAHKALGAAGYSLIHIEGCNCLYIHPAIQRIAIS